MKTLIVFLFVLVMAFSSQLAKAQSCWNFGLGSNPIHIEIDSKCITDPYKGTPIASSSFCATVRGYGGGYVMFYSDAIDGSPVRANNNEKVASACMSLKSGQTSAWVTPTGYVGGVSSGYYNMGGFAVTTGGGLEVKAISLTPAAPTNVDTIKLDVEVDDVSATGLNYRWLSLKSADADYTKRLELCHGSSCQLSPLPPDSYTLEVSVDNGQGGSSSKTLNFATTERVGAQCSYSLEGAISVSCSYVDRTPSASPSVSIDSTTVYATLAEDGIQVGGTGGTTLQHNPFNLLLNTNFYVNSQLQDNAGLATLFDLKTAGATLDIEYYLNFGAMAENLAGAYWPNPSAPVVLPLMLETDLPFASRVKLDISIDRIANLKSVHVIERPGCTQSIGCTVATANNPLASGRTNPLSVYRQSANDFTPRVVLYDATRNWLGGAEVTMDSDKDLRLTGGTEIFIDARNLEPVLCPSCYGALRADGTSEPYWVVLAASFLDGVSGSIALSSDAPGNHTFKIGKAGSEAFTSGQKYWTWWSKAADLVKGQALKQTIKKVVPGSSVVMGAQTLLEIAQTKQRIKYMRLNSAVLIETTPDGNIRLTTREGAASVFSVDETSSAQFISAGQTGAIDYENGSMAVRSSTSEEAALADDALTALAAATSELRGNKLYTATLSGQSTSALVYGGVKKTGGNYASNFGLSDSLDVLFDIQVNPSHVGKSGHIYIAAQYNGLWFLKEGQNWKPWDGQLPTLLATGSPRTLQTVEAITVTSGLTNLPGQFSVYVGYGVGDGDVHFNSEPLNFSVTGS